MRFHVRRTNRGTSVLYAISDNGKKSTLINEDADPDRLMSKQARAKIRQLVAREKVAS